MITLTVKFPVPPAEVYNAWLDSQGHSAMTGGEAKMSREEGGAFTAWDGYIFGTNVELEENQKIVQAWRTTEFSDDDPDSELVIELEPDGKGTLLTLTHSNTPEDQESSYEQGWEEHYFQPMREYFE